MDICLWLLVLVFAAQFFLAPLTVFFRRRFFANIYTPFDPRGAAPDDPEEALFERTIAQLEDVGFELAGHFCALAEPEWPRCRSSLLIDQQAGATAQLVAITADPRIEERYIEFETEFRDGSSIASNNSSIPPGSFVPPPDRTNFQFSDVGDALHLYRLHNAALAKFAERREKTVPTRDSAAEHLLRSSRREFERQVRLGLMRRTEQTDIYAPTLSGAFRLCARNAFPVCQISKALVRRRMRRVERSLIRLIEG